LRVRRHSACPTADKLREIVAERRARRRKYRLLGRRRRRRQGTRRRGDPPTTPPSRPSTLVGTSWLVLGSHAFAQRPTVTRSRSASSCAATRSARSEEADALALQVDMDAARRASLARYFAIAKDLRVEIRDIDPLVEEHGRGRPLRAKTRSRTHRAGAPCT
jgi:hypothetical protein